MVKWAAIKNKILQAIDAATFETSEEGEDVCPACGMDIPEGVDMCPHCQHQMPKDRWSMTPDHMADGHIMMFDTIALDDVRPTKDGYLTCMPRVARTGIQVYKGKELGRPDLGDVAVYRPPSEVFSKDAMHSMAHRPVTYTHPPEQVNAKNWKKYAVGQTGDEVTRDGECVRVPMTLMDAATIDIYKRGEAKELSVGYSTDLKWTPGVTPEGQAYDAVQTSIRGNHLAIVPVARGGSTLRMGDTWSPEARAAAEEAHHKECPTCQGKGLIKKSMEYGKYSRPTAPQTCPTCKGTGQVKDAAMNDDFSGEEVDPEMRIYLRILANPKKSPFDKKAAAAELHTLCLANYPENGQQRYDELTNGLDVGDSADLSDAEFLESYDREFSEEKREHLAKTGAALPGGGFPIQNTHDLRNAVRAIGRAKNPAAAKAHIKQRAKALGAESELPEDWKTTDADTSITQGANSMAEVRNIEGVPVAFVDAAGAAFVQKHITNLHSMAADLQGKLDKSAADKEMDDEKKLRQEKDAKATADALEGKVVALEKQLTDAKALATPAILDKLVKDRAVVMDGAKAILGDAVKFDGKTDVEIKRAAVAKQLGDATVKEMSDEKVGGAFDMLTANVRKGGGTAALARAIHQQQSNSPGMMDGADLRDAAMRDNERFLNTAWQKGKPQFAQSSSDAK